MELLLLWFAAVSMGWLGEARRHLGSALIALIGFLTVSGVFVRLLLSDAQTSLQALVVAPEAIALFYALATPRGLMIMAAVLVLAVFGPFILLIEAEPELSKADRPRTETARGPAAERREPEV